MNPARSIANGAFTVDSFKRYFDPNHIKRTLLRQFLKSKADVSFKGISTELSADESALEIHINLSLSIPAELSQYFNEHEEELGIREQVNRQMAWRTT